jgi:hypothetical protein
MVLRSCPRGWVESKIIIITDILRILGCPFQVKRIFRSKNETWTMAGKPMFSSWKDKFSLDGPGTRSLALDHSQISFIVRRLETAHDPAP